MATSGNRVERPTTDPRRVVLDGFDRVWTQFRERLDGLDADEYLWEPVAGMWSLRPIDDSSGLVDGAGDRERDPAPVTTIAWRLWHVAHDCLDSYTARILSGIDMDVAGATWHLDPARAVAALDASGAAFRAALAERTTEEWWAPLGPAFDHWSDHNLYDMALHARHEVAHHGAEVALLRDLYRNRPLSSS